MVGGNHPGTGHKSSLCGTALKKWLKTGTIEKRDENKAIIRKVNKEVKPTHMSCKQNMNDRWNILYNTEWKFCVLITRYVQHTPCTWYWNGKRMGSSANATQDLGNKSMPTSSLILFLILCPFWFHTCCNWRDCMISFDPQYYFKLKFVQKNTLA